MHFFRKIDKIPLGFEKKRLKTVQERSLSKIVHVFVIVVMKNEVLFFQLPLKVDSTVEVRKRVFLITVADLLSNTEHKS